jgi:hypothetical protein
MVVTGGGAFTQSEDTAASINSSDWDTTGSVPDVWFVSMNNPIGGTDTTFFVDAICTQPTSVSLAGAKAAVSARRAAHK